jgi:hypothetical protein
MKILYVFLLTIPVFSFGQRYALIDKHAKKPILYTDSLSLQQVKDGYFPVEKTKIDSFLANLSYLSDMFKGITRAKMQSFELRNGESTIKVERVPQAYGDRYIAVAETKSNVVSAVTPLTNLKISGKKNRAALKRLIGYITNNQSLYDRYREITPKIYNVVVIKE